MLLTDKTAVVYGAGGSIGGAVARAFAAEGARVHLVGRTRETLEAVAGDLKDAEVAVVDALDESAVTEHLARVGDIDVSFNLVSRGDVQGLPITDMPVDDFLRPVINGTRANFITARAAARRMAERGRGVVLTLNSGSAHGSPMMGGTGPADAATDSLVRNLAMELGPRGVRAVGLRAAGDPRDPHRREARQGQPRPQRGGDPGHPRPPVGPAHDPPQPHPRGDHRDRRLPRLGPRGEHHRHVRQCHGRDVPGLSGRRRAPGRCTGRPSSS